jgi:hypothetical protein
VRTLREDTQPDGLETRSPYSPVTELPSEDEMTPARQPQLRIQIMTISALRIVGALGAFIVLTAAMCNKDAGAAAAPRSASAPAFAAATASGPGLPSDFPLAPGLSPCTPIVTGPEVICDWHNVDGHAIFTFYHEALPKAGYTLRDGAGEVFTPHYLGLIAFTKGDVKGAITIPNTDLTIQVVTGY